MAVFGFMGQFPAPHPFDTLVDYGTTLARAQELPASSRVDSLYACWGSRVAADRGVCVALRGQVRGAAQGADPAAAILNAYRRTGNRVLETLSGRFALAILDAPGRRILLAVDPMGIERLTYAYLEECLVFGTSAESVAHFPLLAAPVSPQGVFNYLLLHMVPAPGTVFEGVQKLRPGTCAIYENGRIRIERYWRPRFREGRGASFDTLKTELHASLRSAVRSCEPDEETGAFLSGGVDSSTVAGVLSEVGPRPAKTFSIGFGYPDYDELPYARIANARFGCQPHEYVMRDADIAATFALIARAYDEPFGNASALPVYYCARLAHANGVRHLLGGDGGDEIFAGNSRYAEQHIYERYQLAPRCVRRALLEPLLARWPRALAPWPVRKAQGYVQKANVPLPERLEIWNVIHQRGAAELLHPDFLTAVDTTAPFADMQNVWDAAESDSSLNRMLHYDWQYTLADNDLRKVETMSALAGVRVSYPMLHADVVDMSLRVPASLKMPGIRLRHFYKQAMQGFLPDEIIHKKKHGFGLPFGLWLQASPPLRELIFGNLAELRTRRLFRPEFIERLLHLHEHEDARHYGVFLWVLAMLEQWLQEHHLNIAI
jgi:asparagine synthase (glutamine-hydrolysing)